MTLAMSYVGLQWSAVNERYSYRLKINKKSLGFTRGLTVKTKTLSFKTKTTFLVLEVPRDQDQSLALRFGVNIVVGI